MDAKKLTPIKPDVPIPGAQSSVGLDAQNMTAIDTPTSIDDLRVVLRQSGKFVHAPLDAAQVGLDTVYQPLDSDLTAIAALTTTTYGRALLELANAAAGRTVLGLGTVATQAYTASTWTPDIGGASVDGGVNVTVNDADYIQIGNVVTATFDIQVASISGSPSGTIQIKDLPASANGPATCAVRALSLAANPANCGGWWGSMSGANLLLFYSVTTNGGMWSASAANTHLTTGTRFIGSVSYLAS